MSKTFNLAFYECEHNGDLEMYIDDIKASGGKVIESRVDFDDETGYVTVEAADYWDFTQKFKETEAYCFIT